MATTYLYTYKHIYVKSYFSLIIKIYKRSSEFKIETIFIYS